LVPHGIPSVWRVGPVVAVLLLAMPRPGVLAQQARPWVGVAVTHSLSSGIAARRACPSPCRRPDDILAPVSISSLEVETRFAVRRMPAGGLDYIVRAVPVAVVRNNPTAEAEMGILGWRLSPSTPRSATLGFGLKPLGFGGWLEHRPWTFHGALSTGFVWFGSPVLASNAARFNFVAELGVGVIYDTPGPGRLQLAYRRHHLSNAGFAQVNPGLNSNVVVVGWMLR
jgi:hypothetical protein